MSIQRLDHVNLRTAQLAAMVSWYRDILELEPGARPAFGFPGAWLYAGDHAIVHLVEVDGPVGAGSEAALKLEHFALQASDLAAFKARLEAHGERYREARIGELDLVQINVWDPDGNHIHVDFTGEG